jgi:hypothetical protein
MLNLCPIPPTELERPKPSTSTETSSDLPPHLWSQMAPTSRQQLSQMIAELIRRTQLPHQAKETVNEKAA